MVIDKKRTMQLDLKGRKIFLLGSCLLFSPQKENNLSGPWHLGTDKGTYARSFNTQDRASFEATRNIIAVSEKHYRNQLWSFGLFWNLKEQ